MPINANLVERDPDCDLNLVVGAPRRQRVRMTLSNSFGFGGSNSCVVLRHPDEVDGRRAQGLSDGATRESSSPAPAPSARRAWIPAAILAAVRAGRSAIAPIAAMGHDRLAVRDRRPRSPTSIRARWSTTASCTSSSAAPTCSASTPASQRDRRVRHHRAPRHAGGGRRGRDSATARGVYVGSGGGSYENQYDYFPLMTEADGDLPTFGRELANTVNPMWLLRTLPNNVLGHIGIKYGLKGTNACITNHSVGGTLAVIEAMEALRNGEADRAVAVGHDTPIEPQMVLYYHRCGLLARDALRPFDARARRQPVRRRRRRAGARDRSVRARAATPPCSARCWAAATPAKRRGCSRSATTATASRARSRRRWTTRSSRPRTSA